jgi:hypothetical protein
MKRLNSWASCSLVEDIGEEAFYRAQMKVKTNQARAIRNNIVDQILEVGHETDTKQNNGRWLY